MKEMASGYLRNARSENPESIYLRSSYHPGYMDLGMLLSWDPKCMQRANAPSANSSKVFTIRQPSPLYVTYF